MIRAHHRNFSEAWLSLIQWPCLPNAYGTWKLNKWGETFSPYQSRTWTMSSFAFYILSLLPDRISKGITVGISDDRLVAVTLPLRYKIICRPMRITVVNVLIYVIIASTCLPEIVDVFLYHIQTGENRRNDSYIGKQYMKDIIFQSKLKSVHFLLNIFLFDFLPTPVVLVCNTGIVVCFRKSNIKKSFINEAQQQRKHKERKLTKLLLTISMLFLVLAGPSAIYSRPDQHKSNTKRSVCVQACTEHFINALSCEQFHQFHRLCRDEQEIPRRIFCHPLLHMSTWINDSPPQKKKNWTPPPLKHSMFNIEHFIAYCTPQQSKQIDIFLLVSRFPTVFVYCIVAMCLIMKYILIELTLRYYIILLTFI